MLISFLLTCCLTAPAEISIDSDTITLGTLIPFPAGDPRASLSFGYAPNPGLARRIFKQDVLTKLRAAALPTEDLDLPDAILVRRRSQGLDQERVTQVVLDAFTRAYPGANIEIISVEIPAVQIGTGPVELAASVPAKLDPTNAVFVRVEVRSNSSSKSVFARTRVRIETIQPLLRSPIAAHTGIRPEDVEWKPAPLQGFREAISSLEAVAGMLTKRDLETGQVLTTDLLYSPVYVQRGDSVTVRATAGGVSISATMRAKASGKYGESVLVEHLSGTGTATARVVGPRLLEALEEK